MPSSIHPGGPPSLTVDQLRAAVLAGEVDTVIVAFTDMQGRLQGKRLHGHYFIEHVLEHGTEGCNYLLAVDVDMNTVEGYAMSSWSAATATCSSRWTSPPCGTPRGTRRR